MKFRSLLLILPFLFALMACEGLDSGLTDAEIVSGLKEALEVGTDTSSTRLHAQDGYYGNPKVKIPFPSNVQYVADALMNFHLLGQPVGATAVNALILKLNRAAEGAADKAKPIFLSAITNMTVTDGLTILMGNDTAATSYLKGQTYTDLKTAFKPDIETSLNQVGAQAAWNDVTNYYNLISTNPVNTDLADHTTGKALDGLFVLIAEEELKIRTDVSYRISDLLKKVFAEQD
jgi:Protein of unknown function (DUF4197)